MSTTFGVKIPSTGEVIPIARRMNGNINFTNPLSELLKDKTKVIAMNNSHQGIHTIKDLKDGQSNN
jgi:hypothetical protein